LSNLGAGANDGIRNHFWGAFQTAVQEWFSQKVEEVLGLGITIWNVLKQGGINVAEVGKMAWEGIKSAIPGVLIQILIEKVVSMIVPAAGTVMLIIEGLQAAWGTVSRILQAFERFMAFLKAVKTGQAGPPFGAALASAGVVVIDFVANWLLKRLRGPASKVAGKIKEIATKIGNKVKKVLKKLGKKFGKFKDKFFGKKKGKGDQGKGRQSNSKDNNKNKEDQERKKQEKLDRAVEAIQPQVDQMLTRGTTKLVLRAKLLFWKVRYRLTSLTLDSSGKIEATVNPKKVVANGRKLKPSELGQILEPVLKLAEEDYDKWLANEPQVAERQKEAHQRIANKEDISSLPHDEQRLIFGSAETWAREKQGVKLGEGNWVQIGNPSNPAELKLHMNQDTTYPKLLRSLRRLQGQVGLSDADIASLLSNKDSSTLDSKLDSKLAELKSKVPQDKQDILDSRVTKKLLKGISSLTQTIEPIRKPGVATAHALGFTFVERGDGNLTDVIGRTGKWAPMTRIGSSSSRNNSQTRSATLYRHRRIGNIFEHLLNEAQKADIFVKDSGYNLRGLADAVQAWLNATFSNKVDPETLASKQAILRAEIKMLLQSYNGR